MILGAFQSTMMLRRAALQIKMYIPAVLCEERSQNLEKVTKKRMLFLINH
jgi:hypothetical protein